MAAHLPFRQRLRAGSLRADREIAGWESKFEFRGLPADSRVCRWLTGLALSAVALATPVGAAELVPPDPWEIIHLAREMGPAEVGRDGMKDPQIRGTVDGLHYRIDFYGCRLGRDCDTILLEARFARKEWKEAPPEEDVFADWNRTKLFGRAWADDEGRAVLDHPITMAAGLPAETLRAVLSRWRKTLEEYASHLNIR